MNSKFLIISTSHVSIRHIIFAAKTVSASWVYKNSCTGLKVFSFFSKYEIEVI